MPFFLHEENWKVTTKTFFRVSCVLIDKKKEKSHDEIENGFIKENIS